MAGYREALDRVRVRPLVGLQIVVEVGQRRGCCGSDQLPLPPVPESPGFPAVCTT